jgi:peptidoglycan/LPS O-acetylase OafA/YrhL
VSHTKRIPSLDGWRGIAILLVLVAHTAHSCFSGAAPHFLLNAGKSGVALFFVLSGFLITSNLLKGISLRSFYIRRIFRLWPVSWGFLLLLWAAHASPYNDLITSLFCVRNFHAGSWPTLHFWSLSIEEQFYLVWPATLLVLGPRRSLWLLSLVAITGAAWSALANPSGWDSVFQTQYHVDALCLGCITGLTAEKYVKVFRFAFWPALLFASAHIAMASSSDVVPIGESICFALIVGNAAIYPHALQNRLVSFKPLVFLGLISYSVYVWQQLFFTGHVPLWHMPAAVLVGCASYFAIERPMMNLGRKSASTLRVIENRAPECARASE